MIIAFLLNNNIKNKNEFYLTFVNGFIDAYTHGLEGQEMTMYIFYRKNYLLNYYECDIIINYSTDIFNFIYGIKIGNENYDKNFIKDYEKKSGLIFNCSKEDDENYFKNNLPFFHYVKYNGKDFNEKTIENFFDIKNKEIKKLQYYYSCKDPLTGKIKGKYR